MIGSVLRIRYAVNQLIYENAIFSAYAAFDQVAGRDVCVKVFKPPFSQEKEFVEASFFHAQKASAIQHPGIEKVLELDDHEGLPFLVCELARGTVLRERLRRFAPFSVPVAVGMAISVCEPLYALHKAGIVHGDVSAENAIISADGSAVLLQSGQWQAYSFSRTAGMVCLPAMAPYLAPEVTAGGMPSPESDVYAVGVLLYELLTGHAPHRADTPLALAMKHASEAPPRVKALNSSVPMVLDEIVHKALAKDPLQRYRSMGELLSDLRYLQDALRFGRSLSWPIRPDAVSERPRVAPRMSAVREPEPPQPKKARSRDVADDEPAASDVPGWMRLAAMLVVAIFVFFIGWWLFVSLNSKKEVKVPNIIGQPISEAANILATNRLRLQVARKEASEKYDADTVIDCNPAVGETVKEDKVIFVTLSTGSRFVEVPDLRGFTLDKAQSLLKKLNLDCDERVIYRRSLSVGEGLVIGQNFEPRTSVEQGTKIQLTVSSGGRGPESVNDSESRDYEVSVTLTGLEEPVTLRVDLVDDRGQRTIFEEERQPNETVNIKATGWGREVTFKIYYDGELKKQITKSVDEASP